MSTTRIHFAWLIRLRWAAIAGQLVTIATAHWAMGIALPLAPLLGLVAVEVAFNVGCTVWQRAGRGVSDAGLAGAMAGDVLAFTGLLYFTGGPFNPFSFLYLVYIALAAVVLEPRWTWALVGLSLVCSAALFADAHELPMSHHDHMSTHLRGMWVALGVAAAFIVYFLLRVTSALAQRERELAHARQLADRQEKLASLATLAAGAAHELSTPLATIATVAKELERALGEGDTRLREDAALIRSQVDRCRAILTQMSVDAGESTGEGLARIEVAALLAEATDTGRSTPPVAMQIDEDARARALTVPRRAVAQAIRGLVDNAQDAAADDRDVIVGAAVVDDHLVVEVRDRGAGMAPDVLARVGEPFFTTKAPGRGMGLGVFLTRAVVERLGGSVELASTVGEGTVARLTLPLTATAATNHRIGSAA